ncbi:MAG: hypothetical protein RIQ60_1633 [Pseudomonadota bacterium]|jgi:hypothetical protein
MKRTTTATAALTAATTAAITAAFGSTTTLASLALLGALAGPADLRAATPPAEPAVARPAQPSSGPQPQPQPQQQQQLHTRQIALQNFLAAVDGDTARIEPAAEQFAALSAADAADPVLRAYAGAATAMRANTTLLPWRKLKFAEDGLAQLDKALAQLGAAQERASAGTSPGNIPGSVASAISTAPAAVPAALEVRYVAASTFLALPGLFNRGARGEQLLAQVLAAPALAQAPAAFQATVWLQAGRHAAKAGRKDEARLSLQRAAESGVTQQASAARLTLQGL